MKVDKNIFRELVKEVMSEMDESDLVVKDNGTTWEEMSDNLRTEVEQLINNITNDKYPQALDDISGIAATMKIWKNRIVMGGARKNKGSEEYDLKRFNLAEKKQIKK